MNKPKKSDWHKARSAFNADAQRREADWALEHEPDLARELHIKADLGD